MSDWVSVLVGAALVNNVALQQFLGLCPLLGGSRQLPAAHGLGMATTLVLTLGAGLTHLVQHYWLLPLKLEILQTLVFIVLIASLVQLLEALLRAYQPILHQKLGLYLPLITSNCAVLGVMLLNDHAGRDLAAALLYGLGAGLGFWLVLVILACQRQRLELADAPQAWRGAPLALVSAGLTALAFLGLAGLGGT